MQLKEMRWNGLLIWPPQWTEKSPKSVENWLLKNVQLLPITNLIRVDASYDGKIISGLILSEEDYRSSIYFKLKGNIGKPLEEVANMDIYC